MPGRMSCPAARSSGQPLPGRSPCILTYFSLMSPPLRWIPIWWEKCSGSFGIWPFENPKREKTRQFIRQLRTLSLDIASTDFDYPGLSTEILAFCQLQLLSPALIRNIQLAVEELVLQTILPALGEDAIPMKLSQEYSDADMSTELLLQYGGRAYNPLKEGDELSLRIVKSVAEEWSYEYREQNYLRMRFRQKD